MKKLVLVLLLGSLGCSGIRGTLPYLSTGPAPAHRRLGPVRGADCTATIFGGHTRDIRLEHALEHALDGTEATGLVDVEVTVESAGPETCLVVPGVAVR